MNTVTMIRPALAVLLGLAFCSPVHGEDQTAQAKARIPSQPVHMTSEQDHQRIMDLLHVTSLRRGADGDAKSPFAANCNESKTKA